MKKLFLLGWEVRGLTWWINAPAGSKVELDFKIRCMDGWEFVFVPPLSYPFFLSLLISLITIAFQFLSLFSSLPVDHIYHFLAFPLLSFQFFLTSSTPSVSRLPVSPSFHFLIPPLCLVLSSWLSVLLSLSLLSVHYRSLSQINILITGPA